MLNPFTNRFLRSRRWVYPLISLTVTVSIWLGQPILAQALPWGDLILRGVQVIQLSNISDSQEVQIGQQINQELIRSQVKLYRDPRIQGYVDEIGQRLAANSDRPKLPYTFQVVDDSSVNAFATMGGFVYINTGLLKRADNEAQLASVIGHEIGHIAGRHAVEQMKKVAMTRFGTTALNLGRSNLGSIGVELARRGFSRKDEFIADEFGFRMLTRSGYASSAMVDFMAKLQKGSVNVPTLLNTHPATGDRIVRLQQMITASKANGGDGLDTASYREKIRVLL